MRERRDGDMKITREWLARTPHCEAGRAFGLAALPPEGLELSECWERIDRPDFLLGLAHVAAVTTYGDGEGAVEAVLSKVAGEFPYSKVAHLFRHLDGWRLRAAVVQADSAEEAYCLLTLMSCEKEAALYNALALLASARIAEDQDQARVDSRTGQPVTWTRLQGAARQIGEAVGHGRVASMLKAELGLSSVRAK